MNEFILYFNTRYFHFNCFGLGKVEVIRDTGNNGQQIKKKNSFDFATNGDNARVIFFFSRYYRQQLKCLQIIC